MLSAHSLRGSSDGCDRWMPTAFSGDLEGVPSSQLEPQPLQASKEWMCILCCSNQIKNHKLKHGYESITGGRTHFCLWDLMVSVARHCLLPAEKSLEQMFLGREVAGALQGAPLNTRELRRASNEDRTAC